MQSYVNTVKINYVVSVYFVVVVVIALAFVGDSVKEFATVLILAARIIFLNKYSYVPALSTIKQYNYAYEQLKNRK